VKGAGYEVQDVGDIGCCAESGTGEVAEGVEVGVVEGVEEQVEEEGLGIGSVVG
jgi:hypothetical protein